MLIQRRPAHKWAARSNATKALKPAKRAEDFVFALFTGPDRAALAQAGRVWRQVGLGTKPAYLRCRRYKEYRVTRSCKQLFQHDAGVEPFISCHVSIPGNTQERNLDLDLRFALRRVVVLLWRLMFSAYHLPSWLKQLATMKPGCECSAVPAHDGYMQGPL